MISRVMKLEDCQRLNKQRISKRLWGYRGKWIKGMNMAAKKDMQNKWHFRENGGWVNETQKEEVKEIFMGSRREHKKLK